MNYQNKQTNEYWEKKEARELFIRVFNSLCINEEKEAHVTRYMEIAKRVVDKAFEYYNEDKNIGEEELKFPKKNA